MMINQIPTSLNSIYTSPKNTNTSDRFRVQRVHDRLRLLGDFTLGFDPLHRDHALRAVRGGEPGKAAIGLCLPHQLHTLGGVLVGLRRVCLDVGVWCACAGSGRCTCALALIISSSAIA